MTSAVQRWFFDAQLPRPPPLGYVGVYDPRRERINQLWLAAIFTASGVLCTLAVQSVMHDLRVARESRVVTPSVPVLVASGNGGTTIMSSTMGAFATTDSSNATRYPHMCDRSMPFLDNVEYVHVFEYTVDTRLQDHIEQLCLKRLYLHPHGGWYQKWSSHRVLCAAFTETPRRGLPLLADGLEFGAVCAPKDMLAHVTRRQRKRTARGVCSAPMGVQACSRNIIGAVRRRRWLVESPLQLAARAEAVVTRRRPPLPRLAAREPESLQDLDAPLWLEFGSWNGRSTRELSDASYVHGRVSPLFSFDSFRGLPEDWRPAALGQPDARSAFERTWLSKGSFDRAGLPPFVRTPRLNVEWVTGWFNATLPPFLDAHRQNVSLVHIDCDIYSSSEFVLRHLEPRLSPGAILAFDELINYPEYQDHELLALAELLVRTRRPFEVLGSTAANVVTEPEELRRRIRAAGSESGTLGQQVVIRLD